MENRAHAIAAGSFVLLLAAALVAAGFWFRKDDIRLAHYVVTTTTSVAGLQAEARVRYRGVDVGRVESIQIDPGVSGSISIRIGIKEDTPITRSTYAQLGYQGVTGLAYVSLDDDGSSSELLRSTDPDAARIAMRPSLLDSGRDLLTAVNELAGRMNDLLNPENRQLARRALAGVEQMARQTAVLAGELQPGARGIPTLVGEARTALAGAEKMTASMRALAVNLEERAKAFDRMAASLEEVGAAARSFNDDTLPRFNALVEQLNRDTRSLDRVLNALGERPQSFVFGAARGTPGPGESGFKDGGR